MACIPVLRCGWKNLLYETQGRPAGGRRRRSSSAVTTGRPAWMGAPLSGPRVRSKRMGPFRKLLASVLIRSSNIQELSHVASIQADLSSSFVLHAAELLDHSPKLVEQVRGDWDFMRDCCGGYAGVRAARLAA
jgi:hypothetical protein